MTVIRDAVHPILSKASKDNEEWVVRVRQQVLELLARRPQRERAHAQAMWTARPHEEAHRADSTALGDAETSQTQA